MKFKIPFFIAIVCISTLYVSCDKALVQLQEGMIISKSIVVEPNTYQFSRGDSLNQPAIIIEGNDIEIDFNGAVLVGNEDMTRPDLFKGLGILVKKGKNITIKNLTIKGYKVGLLGEAVEKLTIMDSDFSYSYRQKMKSNREKEALSDWLYYHNNEKNEWLRYGAALYLKGCNQAMVKNVKAVQGQNGLMLVGCNNGLFYNNTFQFNSGVGIGLYRSSENKIMHNRLDFNVRGYSHGIYQRGQDSAGILVYEQSHSNIFAYNSATHSGDGFFLWAGTETMNSGKGGCNDNLVYGNDFSFAPANGIEATFSRNLLISNILEGCRYGIWAGYSYETFILGNQFKDNEHGIAIEQGNNNEIQYNQFIGDGVGIKTWERSKQPEDWGFATFRDVSSRNYNIHHNYFDGVTVPFYLHNTNRIKVLDNILKGSKSTSDLKNNTLVYLKNNKEIEGNATIDLDTFFKVKVLQTYAPEKRKDGIDATLSDFYQRGKKYILINEWGPYNFEYPSVWLRQIEGNRYTFALFGPAVGNWKFIGSEGVTQAGPKTGTFPTTFVATVDDKSPIYLKFEYIGSPFTDQFGQVYRKGQPFVFEFSKAKNPT